MIFVFGGKVERGAQPGMEAFDCPPRRAEGCAEPRGSSDRAAHLGAGAMRRRAKAAQPRWLPMGVRTGEEVGGNANCRDDGAAISERDGGVAHCAGEVAPREQNRAGR